MKIYLDNSVLNRPFDDQSVPKVRLETVAMLFIVELIERKKIELVNSLVVEYENSKNPFLKRKIWISAYLSRASFFQKLNVKIKNRAKELEKDNISPIDSLHLASAEAAKVDFFITCDYDIIRRYEGKLEAINPIQFIQILKSR